MESESQWFYVSHEKRLGPVDTAELKRLILDGTIGDDTQVWKEDFKDWKPASEVNELFPKRAALPQSPPPLQKKKATSSNAKNVFGFGNEPTKAEPKQEERSVSSPPPVVPLPRKKPPPLTPEDSPGQTPPTSIPQPLPLASQNSLVSPRWALAAHLGAVLLFLSTTFLNLFGYDAVAALEIIAPCLVLAALALSLLSLYQFWSILPDSLRELSPGKAVGFLFIPGFNVYWVYRAVWSLAIRTNESLANRQLEKIAPERLALSLCILITSVIVNAVVASGRLNLFFVLQLISIFAIYPVAFLWLLAQSRATFRLLGKSDPVPYAGYWRVGYGSLCTILTLALLVPIAMENWGGGEKARPSTGDTALDEILANADAKFKDKVLLLPREQRPDAWRRHLIETSEIEYMFCLQKEGHRLMMKNRRIYGNHRAAIQATVRELPGNPAVNRRYLEETYGRAKEPTIQEDGQTAPSRQPPASRSNYSLPSIVNDGAEARRIEELRRKQSNTTYAIKQQRSIISSLEAGNRRTNTSIEYYSKQLQRHVAKFKKGDKLYGRLAEKDRQHLSNFRLGIKNNEQKKAEALNKIESLENEFRHIQLQIDARN